MSFDVTALPSHDSDNENGERLLISLSYSDSTIRTYAYTKTSGFTLLATGRYTSSCLMQLRHITSAESICILTAATDGNLTLWKAPPMSKHNTDNDQLTILSTRKVHQSSIKSLDMAITTDKKRIVCSPLFFHHSSSFFHSTWLFQCPTWYQHSRFERSSPVSDSQIQCLSFHGTFKLQRLSIEMLTMLSFRW